LFLLPTIYTCPNFHRKPETGDEIPVSSFAKEKTSKKKDKKGGAASSPVLLSPASEKLPGKSLRLSSYEGKNDRQE